MKKLPLLLIIIFCLSAAQIQAQKLLTRSQAKITDLKKAKFKAKKFTAHDAFEYAGKSFIIASGIKPDLKLSTGVIGQMAKGMAGAAVDMPGVPLGKVGVFHLNTFLLEMDQSIAGTRGVKVKKINIPAKLEKSKYVYLGFLQEKEKVNLYLGTVNSKQGKTYVFSVSYNITTEAVAVEKVFETEKKNDPVTFFKSKKSNYGGLASAYGKGGNPQLNYLITDIDNKVKGQGNNIEIAPLKKTTITEFLIGTKGELVFGAYNRKGKVHVNDAYILKGDNYKQINIPSKKYHSIRKLYLGINGEIKTAFLAGDDRKYFTELVIADLDLNSGRAINQETKSFESLELDERKKEYKSDKKKDKNAQGGYVLSDAKVAGDGSTMILLEKEDVVRKTEKAANGGVTSYNIYYYGPGKMVLLDKENNFVKTAKLTYRMMGSGLDFLPMDNFNIVVQTASNFTRYNLQRDIVSVSRKGDRNKGYRNSFNLIKGDSKTYIQSGSKIYMVKISERTKFRIQSMEMK